MPGKTAELIFSAHSSLQRTKPPRGPRSVLCVVVVTKSASGTGSGCSFAATRPAMWAMSTMSSAPTSLQISRELGEVDDARVGAGPGDDQLRLVLAGQFGDLRRSRCGGRVLADAVADDLEVLAGEVQLHAVRQVPAVGEVEAEDRVARLEGGEEDGHVRLRAGVRLHVGVVGAEELLRRRSMASRSATSTNSQPP